MDGKYFRYPERLDNFLEIIQEKKNVIENVYISSIITRVKNILNDRPQSWMEVLSKSKNIDPQLLFRILQDLINEGSVVKEDEDIYKYTSKSKRFEKNKHNRACDLKTDKAKLHDYVNNLDYFMIRDLTIQLNSIFPDESPAYSQWWFSENNYGVLLSLLSALIQKNDKLAFLGAPTLGCALSMISDYHISILDIDEEVISTICNQDTKINGIYNYNAYQDSPGWMDGFFDLVWIDPPWSTKLFILFLLRSINIASLGAKIIVSFPPTLTRPTALIERQYILKMLKCYGLSIVSILPEFAKYAVPSFEKNAYKQICINLKKPWRSGDVYIFSKNEDIKIPVNEKFACLLDNEMSWWQVRNRKNRIFIRKDKKEKDNAAFTCVSGLNSIYLPTTSSRNYLWSNIDIITTDDHCLSGSRLHDIYSTFKKYDNEDWMAAWDIFNDQNVDQINDIFLESTIGCRNNI